MSKRSISALTCVLSLLPVLLIAQDTTPPSQSAPLDSVVSVPAAQESVKLDGLLSVQSTVSTAPDGTMTASYSCTATGSGTGQTSNTQYSIGGSSTGQTPLDAPLPADVGFTCALNLTAGDLLQGFNASVQASLDSSGNLQAVVIREITPAP